MVEIPVQLHLELEVNLLVRNVIEREIKREKVQMKPPEMLKNVNANISNLRTTKRLLLIQTTKQ